MQKLIAALILLVLSSCKDEIDINNIEKREHGLSYIKGTNTLVNGKAVLKSKDGKRREVHSYKKGKMIGDFFLYGDKGQLCPMDLVQK
jgi:antitoxin component YwqK of YwqJK toxin-antitoxin module